MLDGSLEGRVGEVRVEAEVIINSKSASFLNCSSLSTLKLYTLESSMTNSCMHHTFFVLHCTHGSNDFCIFHKFQVYALSK